MRTACCDSCTLPLAPTWQGGPERPAGCVHTLQAKGGVGAACFVFHIGCGWAWQALGCMALRMAQLALHDNSGMSWHGMA